MQVRQHILALRDSETNPNSAQSAVYLMHRQSQDHWPFEDSPGTLVATEGYLESRGGQTNTAAPYTARALSLLSSNLGGRPLLTGSLPAKFHSTSKPFVAFMTLFVYSFIRLITFMEDSHK